MVSCCKIENHFVFSKTKIKPFVTKTTKCILSFHGFIKLVHLFNINFILTHFQAKLAAWGQSKLGGTCERRSDYQVGLDIQNSAKGSLQKNNGKQFCPLPKRTPPLKGSLIFIFLSQHFVMLSNVI